MRLHAVIAFALVPLFVPPMHAQGGRTDVRVQLMVNSSTRADSAALVAAIRDGLQADSALHVLDRSASPPPRAEAATFIVQGGMLVTGDRVMVRIRVLSFASSKIVAVESVRAARGDLIRATQELARKVASLKVWGRRVHGGV